MKYNQWTKKNLGEVLNLKRGYDLPVKKRKKGNYPILSSSGVNGYHEDYKIEGPGVTTGRSGLLGKVYFIKDKYWPLNTSLYVEDFKGNDPKFIYYLLQTMKLENYNAGSSVPTLNRNHVHLLKANIPSKYTQKKIGNMLFQFEEKVELNNSIISNLEELAQTLFKRWFVDFEFPNENGEPYKSSGGKMVESELGMIPVGWEIKSIEEYSLNITSGGTPKRNKTEYWFNGTVPWLKTKEINNNYIIDVEEFITPIGLEKSSAKILEKNTVLVAMYGATAGELGMLTFPASTNQACCGIFSETPNYLYQYLINKQSYIKSLASGSAQQNLSKKIISQVNILVSKKDKLIEFESIIKCFSEKIEDALYQNKNLIELRDTLLPKLLSGELKLPESMEVNEDVPVS